MGWPTHFTKYVRLDSITPYCLIYLPWNLKNMALHQLNSAEWSLKTLLKSHIQKLRQLAGSEPLGFDLKTKKTLLWTERSITISLSFVWNEPLSASLGSKVNNSWTRERREKGSFGRELPILRQPVVRSWHGIPVSLIWTATGKKG